MPVSTHSLSSQLHRGKNAAALPNRTLQRRLQFSCRRRFFSCCAVNGIQASQDRLDFAEKGAQNGIQASWAASVRSVSGRKHHRAWKTPQLDPSPCLDNFKVVLVGTKKAPSIGTVARALGAFECLSLCCAAPRVNISSRPSLNSSKGAQYLIHNAQVCDTLEEALQGTTYSVAFARWISDSKQIMIHGLSDLTQQPAVLAALAPPSRTAEQGSHAESPSFQPSAARPRVALVFGREYEGLAEEEIKQCSASCCITMGRLQESLSLSHAVCLVLGHLFEHRLSLMPPEYREKFRVPSTSSSSGSSTTKEAL